MKNIKLFVVFSFLILILGVWIRNEIVFEKIDTDLIQYPFSEPRPAPLPQLGTIKKYNKTFDLMPTNLPPSPAVIGAIGDTTTFGSKYPFTSQPYTYPINASGSSN